MRQYTKNIINQAIAGFELLSLKQQDFFCNQNPLGINIVQTIEKRYAEKNQLHFWNIKYWQYFLSNNEDLVESLIQIISCHNNEYSKIKINIIKNTIKLYFLRSRELSLKEFNKFVTRKDLLYLKDNLLQLHQQKISLLKEFNNNKNTLFSVQNKYTSNYKLQCIEQEILELIFTWLKEKNLRKNYNIKIWYTNNVIYNLPALKKYQLQKFSLNKIFRIIEYYCNSLFSENKINTNIKYKEILLEDLKKLLINKKRLKINKLLQRYQKDLIKELYCKQQEIKYLKKDNSHFTVNHPIKNLIEHLKNILKKSHRSFDNLSDAYMILQFIGIGGQNESMVLNFVDAYNCTRIARELNKIKRIFLPIYNILAYEFKISYMVEKEQYKRMLRLLMPIFIFFGALISSLCFLAKYSFPDIALVISSIPLAILCLFFTAIVINYKNHLKKYLYNAIYPNLADQPFLQVNQNMLCQFGENKSNDIRFMYIGLLNNFRHQEEKFLTILCEWYDIRDNKKLSLFEKNVILKNRYHLQIQDSINFFLSINTKKVAQNTVTLLKQKIIGNEKKIPQNISFFSKKPSLENFLSLKGEIESNISKKI